MQTRLSLLSAAFVTMKHPSEDFGIICDNETAESGPEKDVTATPLRKNPDEKTLELDETSPAKPSRKLQRFFDYEETTFVEDDMTQFDEHEMSGIEINHPEVFRERKCGFCLKRFMLEDTYDDHLDDCIFRTLLEFIKDSNYIVRLKDEVAISNHEFIRRMIFAIQRVNKAIRGMHLPATVGLIDERSTIGGLGAEERTPGRQIMPQTDLQVTPKLNPFFFKYPPPPITPRTRHNSHNNNSFSPAFIPYQPKTRTANERSSFKIHNNNFIGNKSPQQLANRSSSGSAILQTPSPANSSASDSSGMRRVVCKFCDKTFLTITHLDGHMIKEHT